MSSWPFFLSLQYFLFVGCKPVSYDIGLVDSLPHNTALVLFKDRSSLNINKTEVLWGKKYRVVL